MTCPHTHHQIGSVERKHRHIVETGLTLLSHANIPLHYWDHAFLTATYLINRMPLAALQGQSPYSKLYGKLPDTLVLRFLVLLVFLFSDPTTLINCLFILKNVFSWDIHLTTKAINDWIPRVESMFLEMFCFMSIGFPMQKCF